MKIRFGTDGWRGIIARDFTFHNLARVATAYGRYLLEKGGKSVVVGYDTRFQAGAFAEEAAGLLAGMGLKAYLLKGPHPTPMLSFAVRHVGADGGLMLTASHNPPEYLGVKLKGPYGGSALEEEVKRVEALVPESPAEARGTPEPLEVRAAYFDHLKALLDLEALARFPGVLYHDAMGGAGNSLLSAFFRHVGLGVEVRELHNVPHPLFYGVNPEPLPKNLRTLLAVMGPEEPPTFAVATDGDADRIAAVLPGGRFFNPHQVFAVLLSHLHRKGLRGLVVKNFAVSWLIDRLGEKLGLPVRTTPVGFKWITEAFLKEDTLIGGEESGGIGVKGHLPERDGLLNALLLLESVAQTGKDLGAQFSELEALTGLAHAYDRLDLKVPTEGLLERLREPRPLAGLTPKGVEDLDGVKWIYENAWVLFRPSGTEPVVRIYAEGPSEGVVRALLKEAEALVSAKGP
ncbi:phosphomannomutase [Thermus oshimai JL-2]|uniref:Phosphomannomutase n=1 Tax=Thermus oshimai JL-2 TaxID=751945 RepID=K7QVW8_THEOS|nr:phosphomannomutase [Thermus oshimai]AFV75533.1 phosphomannomutase [Thermus oshimai JL-2]